MLKTLIKTLLLILPWVSGSVQAAEKVDFWYGQLQLSLPVAELEVFAQEGKILPHFAVVANQATPEQLVDLRELLRARGNFTPLAITQVAYTPAGEKILQSLGEILRTPANNNGFKALRAGFILAAADPEGLTILNFLKSYPLSRIRVDLEPGLALAGQISEILSLRDQAVATIEKEAAQIAATTPAEPTPSDLTRPGPYGWEVNTLSFDNPQDPRRVPGKVLTDIYLPRLKAGATPPPLVVISHGIASDRTSFTYVARHLATWGMAAAVIEHPGSNSLRYRQVIDSMVTNTEITEVVDFLSRPLEISQLLDLLTQRANSDWKGRLNPTQVGVLGQSKGGYTALALAGASLDIAQLRLDCARYEDGSKTFNLSLLLQCQAKTLPNDRYQLRDPRVKAVFALNPLDSSIFGPQGLGQIAIPTLMVSGSEDYITPALIEQLRPFYWLKTPERYLVLVRNGTHFSTIQVGKNAALQITPSLIGPDPALFFPGVKAMSTAFFKTHLVKDDRFAPYLKQGYLQTLDQKPIKYSVLRRYNEVLARQLGSRLAQLTGLPAPTRP